MNGMPLKLKEFTYLIWILIFFSQKVDETRYIAARNNAAVVGVSESKLDETIVKYKYLTMSCSDVIGTETVEVLLAILEVISFYYKNTFSEGSRKYFCWNSFA